jgi:hypothetical protein
MREKSTKRTALDMQYHRYNITFRRTNDAYRSKFHQT